MSHRVEDPNSAPARLERLEARTAHRTLLFGGFTELLTGSAILALLAAWTDSSWLLPVGVGFALVLLARMAVGAASAAGRIGSETARRAGWAGSTLQGAIWAVAITVFVGHLSLAQALVLGGLLLAHSIVLVAALLPSPAAAGYVIPVLGAWIVQLGGAPRIESQIFVGFFAAFAGAAFWLARRTRAEAVGNLRRRFEAEQRERELERSNQVLRVEELRYRRLFESSEDAMWVMHNRRFAMANDAACRILGYNDPSAFQEAHPGDISPPEQPDGESSVVKANRMMSEAYRKGYHRFEWTHLRSDGTTFPAEVTLTCLSADPVPELFAVVRDITNHHLLVDEMCRARAEAEAANRAKSYFLATMSHEIRTPMNAVLGMSELLRTTELDEEQEEFVATIASSGDSLLSLINDILDFSKIEAGKLELRSEEFDLAQLVRDVGRLFATEAQNKGIELRVDGQGLAVPQIVGDPTRVRQMLVNLVGNAIKFTADGHVCLRAHSAATEGSRVRIVLQVEDTGVGIASEAQKHLFKPFVQADSSTTRHFGGTGLGLAITQRLAVAMEGHIELRSAVGEGSTFTVECFAEQRRNGSSTPEDGGDERKEKPDMKKMKGRVLVVEDALPNQKLAEKMLQLMGLDVEIAENGQIGVDMYEAADYDLVLMDLQMPVMDGYHATQAIRQVQETRSQFRPICAVTANVTSDDRAKCQDVGMDGFLGKPYNFSQLRSKVEELLESSLQPTS